MLGTNMERDGWIYALAAYDYYWDNGSKHILTDQEYDSLTAILRINWEDLSPELKKVFGDREMLGQGATHIKLNRRQLKRAERAVGEFYTSSATHVAGSV